MAIKASAAVTLSAVVDVQAIWRYYLLQSSTLTPPGKPAIYPPPAAWIDTEPLYDPTRTETLYVVDCNVFSDGTFDYTAVSVSTSFEAAKAAYNKATGAENSANQALAEADHNANAIVELDGHTMTEISTSQDEITAEVERQYYVKGETDRIVSEVSTQITQTAEEINIEFIRFEAELASMAAGTKAEFSELKEYIRFVGGAILLGKEGNELELRLSNDRISFFQDGAEVAYLSNNKLTVTDGHFLNVLQIGSFAFTPRTNGNLSFQKITAATSSNVSGLAVVGIAQAG